MDCLCYVDCRVDQRFSNDFLTLNIWGKPVYTYPIRAAQKAGIFQKIIVITDSPKIKAELHKGSGIEIKDSFDESVSFECVCILSGRAALIRPTTLRKAYSEFKRGVLYTVGDGIQYDFLTPYISLSFLEGYEERFVNAFLFCEIKEGKLENGIETRFKLNEDEAVVINSKNDFELTIILKKKEINKDILKKNILLRIHEKENVLKFALNKPSICMLGHSQLDLWEIAELGGFAVRNCGISGISSFEYYNYILNRKLLNCVADSFVVMHGTNDIVLNRETKEIVESIVQTIDYIRLNNVSAPIYFISCIHVNGRLDRNNQSIDQLNMELYQRLKKRVVWIDTSSLDNEFGELKEEYTVDGLHLSEQGYNILKNLLENAVAGRNC